uniref:Uncharacterized protein n=1 Tax=Chromera velia CCMP2878 TaxID=1169474 RepID=A0A0G4HV35_9ALVE|eukprot:Cvel_8757.t1-p1 / transcript=Cvel_8757.t1 / gene=Cvel_8757 / organism=Chromera_velia_CCMP2878 / gene_product=hypothetical protein / transcript_product=hypothetical protein / location=Cvel_scaffold489:80490-85104(+) / protein_length=795 / sequence_SO=supercontig / SO=protein_coding / is_pseudo=false
MFHQGHYQQPSSLHLPPQPQVTQSVYQPQNTGYTHLDYSMHQPPYSHMPSTQDLQPPPQAQPGQIASLAASSRSAVGGASRGMGQMAPPPIPAKPPLILDDNLSDWDDLSICMPIKPKGMAEEEREENEPAQQKQAEEAAADDTPMLQNKQTTPVEMRPFPFHKILEHFALPAVVSTLVVAVISIGFEAVPKNVYAIVAGFLLLSGALCGFVLCEATETIEKNPIHVPIVLSVLFALFTAGAFVGFNTCGLNLTITPIVAIHSSFLPIVLCYIVPGVLIGLAYPLIAPVPTSENFSESVTKSGSVARFGICFALLSIPFIQLTIAAYMGVSAMYLTGLSGSGFTPTGICFLYPVIMGLCKLPLYSLCVPFGGANGKVFDAFEVVLLAFAAIPYRWLFFSIDSFTVVAVIWTVKIGYKMVVFPLFYGKFVLQGKTNCGEDGQQTQLPLGGPPQRAASAVSALPPPPPILGNDLPGKIIRVKEPDVEAPPPDMSPPVGFDYGAQEMQPSPYPPAGDVNPFDLPQTPSAGMDSYAQHGTFESPMAMNDSAYHQETGYPQASPYGYPQGPDASQYYPPPQPAPGQIASFGAPQIPSTLPPAPAQMMAPPVESFTPSGNQRQVFFQEPAHAMVPTLEVPDRAEEQEQSPYGTPIDASQLQRDGTPSQGDAQSGRSPKRMATGEFAKQLSKHSFFVKGDSMDERIAHVSLHVFVFSRKFLQQQYFDSVSSIAVVIFAAASRYLVPSSMFGGMPEQVFILSATVGVVEVFIEVFLTLTMTAANVFFVAIMGMPLPAYGVSSF